TKGKLHFHSRLTLMAQVLVPCWNQLHIRLFERSQIEVLKYSTLSSGLHTWGMMLNQPRRRTAAIAPNNSGENDKGIKRSALASVNIRILICNVGAGGPAQQEVLPPLPLVPQLRIRKPLLQVKILDRNFKASNFRNSTYRKEIVYLQNYKEVELEYQHSTNSELVFCFDPHSGPFAFYGMEQELWLLLEKQSNGHSSKCLLVIILWKRLISLVHAWIGEAEKLALLSSCSAGLGIGCWLCFSSNSLFCFQQSYAPAPHPMAPPSPSTNSSSNHSSSNSSGEQLSKTNLYIRGLPPGTTDQDLIKLCQP
ncbi:hypothetical protein DBR06_SOUSAS310018, partial [Sousa chinensis]